MARKMKYNAPNPTQEAAQEAVEEARKEAPQGALIVYAEFEGYKAGDVFVVPAGWVRDASYEELIVNKQKRREGIVFVTDKGERLVLPVKE